MKSLMIPLDLGSLTYGAVQTGVRLVSTFKILPFAPASSMRGRIQPKISIEGSKSGSSKLIFSLNLLCFYVIFAWVSWTLYGKISEGKIKTEVAMHFLKFLIFTTVVFQLPIFLFRPRQFVAMVNGVDFIQQSVRRMDKGIKCWWSCSIAIIPGLSIFVLVFLFPVLFALISLVFPTYSMFPGSWLFAGTWLQRAPPLSGYLLRGVLAIFEVYSNGAGILLGYCNFMLANSYFISILEWLPALRQPRIARMEKKIGVVKELLLLTNYMNELYESFLSAMIFVICAMRTLALYVTLTSFHSLEIHVYLIFPTISTLLLFIVMVTFAQVGLVKSLSASTVDLWRRQTSPRDAVNHRALRGLRRFGIRALNVVLSLRAPQKMVEQICSALILLLQLKAH